MKRIALAAVAALVGVVVLSACDEDKKKAEILAKTASTDAGTTAAVTTAAPSAAPVASATTEAPKKDPLCATGPEVTLTDKDLDAELRKKLNKPTGPIKTSDLGTVRSLNLTQKQSLDELDPCVIP